MQYDQYGNPIGGPRRGMAPEGAEQETGGDWNYTPQVGRPTDPGMGSDPYGIQIGRPTDPGMGSEPYGLQIGRPTDPAMGLLAGPARPPAMPPSMPPYTPPGPPRGSSSPREGIIDPEPPRGSSSPREGIDPAAALRVGSSSPREGIAPATGGERDAVPGGAPPETGTPPVSSGSDGDPTYHQQQAHHHIRMAFRTAPRASQGYLNRAAQHVDRLHQMLMQGRTVPGTGGQ